MATAMLGKKAGELIEVKAPAGIIKFKIEKITY
jgi:transcription elongation GreA/GreB family factor